MSEHRLQARTAALITLSSNLSQRKWKKYSYKTTLQDTGFPKYEAREINNAASNHLFSVRNGAQHSLLTFLASAVLS